MHNGILVRYVLLEKFGAVILTDLGVVASRLRRLICHPSIPLLYRYPREALLDGPLFGPKKQQQETEPEPKTPPRGNFNLIVAPSPQDQDRCLHQVPGDSDRAPYESLALGFVTLQLGGRDAYAYRLCMPYSNPTKPQEPPQRQER